VIGKVWDGFASWAGTSDRELWTGLIGYGYGIWVMGRTGCGVVAGKRMGMGMGTGTF